MTSQSDQSSNTDEKIGENRKGFSSIHGMEPFVQHDNGGGEDCPVTTESVAETDDTHQFVSLVEWPSWPSVKFPSKYKHDGGGGNRARRAERR